MQQCVEKYLKAFLIFHNQEFRKTHDLSELIEQCRELDPDFEKLLELNVDRLTEYAVELRHPSDLLRLPFPRRSRRSGSQSRQKNSSVRN